MSPRVLLAALLAPPLALLALEKGILGPAARRRQARVRARAPAPPLTQELGNQRPHVVIDAAAPRSLPLSALPGCVPLPPLQLRKENAKQVREALAEAARTAEVMAEAAARKLAAQEAAGGLVVVRAVYGDVDAPGAWADTPPTAREAGSAAPSPARPRRRDADAGGNGDGGDGGGAPPPLVEDASTGTVGAGDEDGSFQSPRVAGAGGGEGAGAADRDLRREGDPRLLPPTRCAARGSRRSLHSCLGC